MILINEFSHSFLIHQMCIILISKCFDHFDQAQNNRYRILRHYDDGSRRKENVFGDLAVATRIHFKQSTFNDATLESLTEKVGLLCQQVSGYSNLLLIAIDAEHEKKIKNALYPITQRYDSSSFQIRYVSINPWIGYTSALNGIIRFVSVNHKHIKHLSFQSAEISNASPKLIIILMVQYMDKNTLVVGPKLKQQKIYAEEDRVETISGANIPWNTFNIWNLEKLKLFGFSLVSDGIIDGVKGGIEEVITISMIQHLNGAETNQCKLIIFDNDELVKWESDSNDETRNKYNAYKLTSKVQRATAQLDQFDTLKPGKVKLIVHKSK